MMLALIFILLFVGGVESIMDDRGVCFHVKHEESRGVSGQERCTGNFRSVIEMLKVSSLVSNSSQLVIELQAAQLLNETVEFENFQGSKSLTIDGKGNEIHCITPESSGIYFSGVNNLQLIDLTLKHCGTIQESTTENTDTLNSTVKFKSGIYILNCTNVSLRTLSVVNSSGTGVTFFDTVGKVEVTNSKFVGNLPNREDPYPGGGGVYIEFTYCTPGIHTACGSRSQHAQNDTDTEYFIGNCTFLNNSAETLNPKRTSYVLGAQNNFQGFGRGGGLAIMFKGHHSGINVTVSNCVFENNTAYWGGGLYIVFRDKSNENKVIVEDTKFINNSAKLNGGGGAKVGFLAYNFIDLFSDVRDNDITMINCTFESNSAEQYGGGIAIVASKGLYNNRFQFINCQWINNKALTSSAVDLSPGVWTILGNGMLPTTIFSDCTFEHNHITSIYKELGPGIKQETRGAGTFLATSFPLKFNGKTEFINNVGTALYLISAVVSFEQGSNVVFRENSGKNGGAIAMIAFSVLYIEDNTSVLFESNTAMRKGGAIYTFSVETHLKSRSCFIQYQGMTILKDERHITLSFINNTAVSGLGHTMYVTSLSPCQHYCKITGGLQPLLSNHTNTFDCVGLVQIADPSSQGLNIATRRGSVTYNKTDSKPLNELVPGKDFYLPLHSRDELEQSQAHAFDITFVPWTHNTSQSLITHRTSNSKINLTGIAGVMEKGTLKYENYDILVSVNVTILKCPPGYTLIEQTGRCDCVQARYKGLWRCDDSKMLAYILREYWIGQCGDQMCTAYCPMGFCSYNDSGGLAKEYPLPYNIDDMEKYVCGLTRAGTLCTKCEYNYSVYFHSKLFSCGENTYCNYGIPLYVASELLPLIVIFTFIITFDVNFTSGYFNGFILYIQMLDTLIITARGPTRLGQTARTLTSIYQLIYGPLNLDFFDSFESLSFCIWEGAEVMDVLAMKYVTILCALLLVVVAVLLWNTRLCAKLSQLSCCHHRTIKNAVIHGLSAFFVMCYSQCAKVSFQILEPAILYGMDNQQLDVVAFLAGDQKYFQGRHLLYAIPATKFLLTLVALPPLLLLSYPLLFRVLSKCNLSELKPVLLLSRLIPMQLLDSFQSCFKDDYRFFAGLYFLYRALILATSTFLPNLFYMYVIIEVELTVILALHAVVQPYKNSTHNKIDSMIFANLAIINGLSLINYYISSQGSITNGEAVQASIYIQLILIYLPLLCIIMYLFMKVAHHMYKRCKEMSVFRRDRSWGILNSTELPPLRESSDDLRVPPNYCAFTSNHENNSALT